MGAKKPQPPPNADHTGKPTPPPPPPPKVQGYTTDELRRMYEHAISQEADIPAGAAGTQKRIALQAQRRIEEKYLAALGRLLPDMLDALEAANAVAERRLALLRELWQHPSCLMQLDDGTPTEPDSIRGRVLAELEQP